MRITVWTPMETSAPANRQFLTTFQNGFVRGSQLRLCVRLCSLLATSRPRACIATYGHSNAVDSFCETRTAREESGCHSG